MSKKTKKSLAAPTQEPKEFETKIKAPKEEFATSLTPVADAEKKEDTAEEKKEETPKSEPAAPDEKKDSVPEKPEEAPDKEKSETKTKDVPAKDKVKNGEKAEVKEDKKSEGDKKVAKPAKKGGSNVILGVSFAVMVAAVGVMGMTMVQNKNADKSSIPAVGGSFSVTGNVAEDTSFTEQAAVAPSTALTSDGRRWAMGASNVLIQAEDGTGAVVPVDAAETFQYDGKSLSFEKDGATYIVRMVADSYTGAAQYAEEQTDESLTVSGMRFAGNGQVLVVVGTRSAGDEEGNAAVRTAVADMLEKAVPAQGSGNITLNGVAVTVDGCEASFSNGLALIKSGDGEVKFTPSSYDSETIAFDDAGTTASGAAVTHSDYANVNDTEAYERDSLKTAVYSYIIDNTTVGEIPQSILDDQRESYRQEIKAIAASYNISEEEYLQQVGAESENALLDTYNDQIKNSVTSLLIFQAIAEEQHIKVTDADVNAYFGNDELSVKQAKSYYGEEFLNQSVLFDKVYTWLVDHASIV